MQKNKLSYGARVLEETIKSNQLQNAVREFIYIPTNPEKISDGIYNPYDMWSANGFLANLGKENPEKMSLEDVYGSGSSDDVFSNLEKYILSDNYSSETYLESSEDVPESSRNNFSSVPRLMGELGNYVEPPSKVSLSELYQASLDITLGNCVHIAKSLIVANIGDYYHKNKEIQEFIRWNLKELGGTNFHVKGLEFLKFGFAVGEKVWSFAESEKGEVKVYLKDIIFSPPTQTQFSIDNTGKMKSALQPILSGSRFGIFEGKEVKEEAMIAYRQLLPSIIPFIEVNRSDLFYVAYDNTYSPYGIAPLRRAYKYYILKASALELFMIALRRNGAPVLCVYFDKTALKNDTDKDKFTKHLKSLELGNSLVMPGKKGTAYETEVLKVDTSSLDVFLDFYKYADEVCQNVFFGLSQSGNSYSSDAKTKETGEDALILYRNCYVEALCEQIIKPLIKCNFSENEHSGNFGEFIGKTREQDKLNKVKEFELGVNSGLVNVDSLDDVNNYRISLGLRPYEQDSELPANNTFGKLLLESSQKTNTRDSSNTPYKNNNGSRE